MIAVFYGADGFSAHEALDTLRTELDTDGQLADNTDRVDGASAKPDELLALCRTMPFLSARRLVVVSGLLGRFEGAGRRGRRKESPLGPWQAFAEGLRELPDTTALVFLDGKLGDSNPLLQEIRPLAADVREFKPLPQNQVAAWVMKRAQQRGLVVEARATAALAGLVGADLRTLDKELDKLAVFTNGRPVTEDDVHELVSLAREPSIFAWADAVVEGRGREASELLQRLLADGEAPQRLLTMLSRQYRLVLLTKELQARRVRPAEMPAQLRVPPFVAQRLLKQAPPYTIERLRQAYRKLLEADLSVKRGVYDDETALELLVVELASVPSHRAS